MILFKIKLQSRHPVRLDDMIMIRGASSWQSYIIDDIGESTMIRGKINVYGKNITSNDCRLLFSTSEYESLINEKVMRHYRDGIKIGDDKNASR